MIVIGSMKAENDRFALALRELVLAVFLQTCGGFRARQPGAGRTYLVQYGIRSLQVFLHALLLLCSC